MSKEKTIPKEGTIFKSFKGVVEWVKNFDGNAVFPYVDWEADYGNLLCELTDWADAGWEEDITKELKDTLHELVKDLKKNKVYICINTSDYYIDNAKKEGWNLYWWNYMIYDEFDWETLEYKGPPRKWKPI